MKSSAHSWLLKDQAFCLSYSFPPKCQAAWGFSPRKCSKRTAVNEHLRTCVSIYTKHFLSKCQSCSKWEKLRKELGILFPEETNNSGTKILSLAPVRLTSLVMYSRLPSNVVPPCLHLKSAEISGMNHHAKTFLDER